MDPHSPSELDRLCDEIALLSAHLHAATARLPDLIREFDACGGWNTGVRSCHHGLDPGAPGEPYQVVVHVDAPVLADPELPGQSVLEDGARVSAEPSRRLACDASRVVMRHDEEGRVVEIGARTPIIPPTLRRALHHRDRGCRFPGCGVRFGPGASSPSLGAWRPDHALEPRAALPPPSPRRPRGGLSGHAWARRDAPVPAAGWPPAA